MKIKPMLGDFGLDGIEYVESCESRALAEHRVPGLAGNYYQDMGAAPNAILIVGSHTGDDARDDFLKGVRDIFNKGESTTFVADINTATDLTDVVIQDLEFSETSDCASTFRYAIRLRRYTEPPEPPSNDLLDTSILDDASSMMDALDALDALGSIGDLSDPTPPVRDALGSVEGATSGLAGTVEQVNGLTGALPDQSAPTDALAPVLGDEGSGTGVAGVLGLLKKVDTQNLSISVSADLDRSATASVAVDTSGITGGSLDELQRAVATVPNDPKTLTKPVDAHLDEIKRLTGDDLLGQLTNGIGGLKDLEALFPADTSSLIAGIADRLSQVKGELIRGQFGEIVQWSDNVGALYKELSPLLAGDGSPEQKLAAYLREKIAAIVAMVLPDGDLGISLPGKLDAAIAPDLPAKLEALKVELIAALGQAKLDFDGANFSNTTHFAAAGAAMNALIELLASATGTLRPLLDQDFLTPAGLGARLQQQFDSLDEVEIVDLGNIKDKFTAAIKKVEDFIRGIDLSAVTAGIESVFGKIDAAIGKLDLHQFTDQLQGLQGKIQSILDAIDGALLEAVAAIRSVFTRIKDAIKGVAEKLGSYDSDGTFHFKMEQQIRDFLDGIRKTLHDTIQPLIDNLKQTVGDTLQQVQDALGKVKAEIDGVKDELQGSLQGVHDQLQSVDVKGTMASISRSLDDMLSQLGTIDFDVVTDPVISEINSMRDSLAKIDVSAMSEFTLGALKVSVAVVTHIDFSTQITAALMAEIDKLLDVPKKALADIEGKVEGALQKFAALAPEALLKPLDDVFKPVTAQLDALKLESLLEPLDKWHAKLEAQLEAVSPAALLKPLVDLYLKLDGMLTAVSPAQLVKPLQDSIDGIKAQIRGIDVTGVAGDISAVVERVKKVLQGLSPAGLLDPVVKAFDKIMAAFDQFDPGILLKPFSDIFGAIADVLANLTADGLKVVADVCAVLRSIVDAFDPRRLFSLIRDKLTGVREIVQKVNVGGLLGALKTPFDAMQASFSAQGGGANVSLSASVDGLNPLRNPKLGQAIEDLQYCQGKLAAIADAQPPAELVARYDKVHDTLESLFPIWARDGVSAASIKRAFEAANPLNVKAEIDQAYGALKDKIRTFDPRVIQNHLQASFDKLQNVVLQLDPTPLFAQVQSVISALTARLDVLDLKLITSELQGVVDEIFAVVRGIDPRPIIARLDDIVGEVKAVVAALKPSELLAGLTAPFEAAKAIVMEFDPAALTKPLTDIFKDIQALIADIKLDVLLKPFTDRLQQLRDALAEALGRTEKAFNDMLHAIPV